MSHDPLAPFRREPRPASNDEPVREPLTEHEALGLAIRALCQTPDRHLPYGDYPDTSALVTALNEVYEKGTEREHHERAEEENLMKDSYERRKALQAIPALFTPKPEPEVTRKRDIEPEM